MEKNTLKQLLFLIFGVITFVLIINFLGIFDGMDLEFEERLEREKAKDGRIRISLIWDNYNDLDLHLKTPSGEIIYFGHKRSSDGGILDVDMNAGSRKSLKPVENIVFLREIPNGKYQIFVNYYNYKNGSPVETDFQIMVKIDDNSQIIKDYLGKKGDKKLIYEFNY